MYYRLHQKKTVFRVAELLCRTFLRLPWVGLREGRSLRKYSDPVYEAPLS